MIGYAFAFLTGIFTGSFLNVCVHRLPRMSSLIVPGSHCTVCGERINWYHNIPLVSYIVLGGQCRRCLAPFSVRYFLIELLMGLLFAFAWHSLTKGRLSLVQFWAYLPLVCALVVSAVVDIQKQIIPDEVSISGIFVGFFLSAVLPSLQPKDDLLVKYLASGVSSQHLRALISSGSGIIIGAGLVHAVGVLGTMLLGKEAMGFGDVKFLGMVGAFLGPLRAVAVFFLGCLVGAVIGIALLLFRRGSRIPFAPYLSFACFGILFFTKELLWLLEKYQSLVAGLALWKF